MIYRLFHVPNAGLGDVPRCESIATLLPLTDYDSGWIASDRVCYGATVEVTAPYSINNLCANILVLADTEISGNTATGITAYRVTGTRTDKETIWVSAEIWGVLTAELNAEQGNPIANGLLNRISLKDSTLSYENEGALGAFDLEDIEVVSYDEPGNRLLFVVTTKYALWLDNAPPFIRNGADGLSSVISAPYSFTITFPDSGFYYELFEKFISALGDRLEKIDRIQLVPAFNLLYYNEDPIDMDLPGILGIARFRRLTGFEPKLITNAVIQKSPHTGTLFTPPEFYRSNYYNASVYIKNYGNEVGRVEYKNGLEGVKVTLKASVVYGFQFYVEVDNGSSITNISISVPEIVAVGEYLTKFFKDNATAMTLQTASTAVSVIGGISLTIAGIAGAAPSGGLTAPLIVGGVVQTAEGVISGISLYNQQKQAITEASRKSISTGAPQASLGQNGGEHFIEVGFTAGTAQARLEANRLFRRIGMAHFTALGNFPPSTNRKYYDHLEGDCKCTFNITPFAPQFCSRQDFEDAFHNEMLAGVTFWHPNSPQDVGNYSLVNPSIED